MVGGGLAEGGLLEVGGGRLAVRGLISFAGGTSLPPLPLLVKGALEASLLAACLAACAPTLLAFANESIELPFLSASGVISLSGDKGSKLLGRPRDPRISSAEMSLDVGRICGDETLSDDPPLRVVSADRIDARGLCWLVLWLGDDESAFLSRIGVAVVIERVVRGEPAGGLHSFFLTLISSASISFDAFANSLCFACRSDNSALTLMSSSIADRFAAPSCLRVSISS